MILIIALLLDVINYFIFSQNSHFLSLFSVISIIYFKKDKKYLIILVLFGLLYDLIFNITFINSILFPLIGILLKFLYKKIKYNYLNNILVGLFILVFYQFLICIISNLLKYSYTLNDYVYIISHYLITNIIFIIIMTYISSKKIK